MRNLISITRTFFAAKFGHCGTCMRQSMAAALAVWSVFGIGLLMWPNSLLQTLIGLSALGLTALWMLHVAAYATRAREERQVDLVERRRALGILLRAAGAGVAASVPVLLWPTEGFAFCGQCTKNADCGKGWTCKNTAPVNSGKICNECVKS
ncbi:MAG: hypothetical protein ACTSP0_04865 [Alphaproteobacteria bacterium]